MCLTIPLKVISIQKEKAFVDFLGKRRVVNSGLVKAKPSDYVIIQNNTIVKKINKKEAKDILKLINNH